MKLIDRRALFSSGAAAALLAASGVSLDAAPQPGGRLRLAMPREGAILDRLVRGAVFDGLTEIAADGTLQGELATAWTGSEDAKHWRFDLRADVVFHSGKPLLARDVIASLIAHDVQTRLNVTSFSTGGDLSVTLDLAEPNPDLPILLADQAFYIAEGGAVDEMPESGVGTGCYRAHRFDAGRHFLGHKVEDHYKAGRAGWVESVEALVIPDASVRAEALKEGFVDIAVLPAAEDLRHLEGLIFHPSAEDMALAVHDKVGVPGVVGQAGSLDDGRLAERWWRL